MIYGHLCILSPSSNGGKSYYFNMFFRYWVLNKAKRKEIYISKGETWFIFKLLYLFVRMYENRVCGTPNSGNRADVSKALGYNG